MIFQMMGPYLQILKNNLTLAYMDMPYYIKFFDSLILMQKLKGKHAM